MSSKLGYIVFYFAFLMFVIFVSGLAGATILTGTAGIENLPTPSILNILGTVQWFFALLTISTEYTILFSLVFIPLTAGLVWVIIEIIRGV